jgi:NADH-quinone oxidoreductase subunit H
MAEIGVIGLRVLSLLGLLMSAAVLLTWLERREWGGRQWLNWV